MTMIGGRSAAGTVDITAGLESRQLDTWLLGSFAASALVLAGIGIYGLLAYSVVQRRREIGIRLALGASRGDVVSQIVADGIRLAGGGGEREGQTPELRPPPETVFRLWLAE